MSATEWIASANIAALPLMAAATNFVTAIMAFAARARRMMRFDPDDMKSECTRVRSHKSEVRIRCHMVFLDQFIEVIWRHDLRETIGEPRAP